MAALVLRFCARAFSSCGERGPLFIAVRGPLTVAASHCGAGSRCAGSVVVAHRLSCSMACGIFPDQGSNPCPLHWQADSQPLRHQGSPTFAILIIICLGVGLFEFILFGTFCASCTWICVSFFRFGTSSAIISSNTFLIPLSLSSPFGTPITCRLAPFTLPHTPHILLSFFFFICTVIEDCCLYPPASDFSR